VCIARGQGIPTLDPNFKPVITRTGGLVSALGVQADGKIIVAGAFNAVNGTARNGLTRLNADGSVDPSFQTGAICCGLGLTASQGSAPVTALVIQKDGKIIIGGGFSMVNGVVRNGLARLNTDGSLDSTFNPGAGLTTSATGSFVPVSELLLQPDGMLLVGGYFTAVDGVPRSGLARLKADGSVDTSFNPGSALAIGFPDFGPLTGMALLSNGQILVAGSFKAFEDVAVPGIARLNPDGSLDFAFAPPLQQQDLRPSVSAVLVQSDGRIIISGFFDAIDAERRPGLARLKSDGNVDLTFAPPIDPAGDDLYTALALQSDGQLIAFRQFAGADSTSHRVIARLKPDGTLDPTFSVELAPGETGQLQVLATAFQPDGKLLVGGSLASAPDSAHWGLLRIATAGTIDSSFSPQLELAEGADANVVSVAAQADRKVLLGGTFTRIDGLTRTFFARLNADGAVDSTFAPVLKSDEPGPSVSAILVQDDGKVLIGGTFSTINGTSRNGIARLNPDGSLDATFDVGSGTIDNGSVGRVTALAVQPDGKVLVGGGFTALNGQPYPWFARLNTNGSLDLSFGTMIGHCADCSAPEIRSIAVLTNGVIEVAGLLNRVNAVIFDGLGRFLPDGSPDTTFVPAITAQEQVNAMVLSPDGKTTVAISSDDPGGNGTRARFLRFNFDGTVDDAFQPGLVVGDGSSAPPVAAMSLDPEGRLVIAGQFASVGAAARHGLARLKPDGALDTTFDGNATFGSGILPPVRKVESLISSVALQSDGGIVVGGNFATVNGQVRLGLARFQADQGVPTGNGPRLSAPARDSTTGSFSMFITGEAGQSYRVERSADFRSWALLRVVTGAATPQTFIDDTAQGQPYRFYRLVAQ
jgi:uncharacterized delta-60 repeat protein